MPKACMPKIRSICVSKDNKKLLVGTYGSEIYELATQNGDVISDKSSFDAKCLVKGHYAPSSTWTNEVWGLCPLNTENDRYLTCSDDATLRLFSSKERK